MSHLKVSPLSQSLGISEEKKLVFPEFSKKIDELYLPLEAALIKYTFLLSGESPPNQNQEKTPSGKKRLDATQLMIELMRTEIPILRSLSDALSNVGLIDYHAMKLWEQGQFAAASGLLNLAELSLQTALWLEPNRADYHLQLGIIQYHYGLNSSDSSHYLDALSEFETTLEYNAKNPNIHTSSNATRMIGAVYFRTGQYEKALEIAEQLIAAEVPTPLDDLKWEKILNRELRAETYEKLGRDEEALQDWSYVAKNRGESSDYLRKAQVEKRLGSKTEAVRDYIHATGESSLWTKLLDCLQWLTQ